MAMDAAHITASAEVERMQTWVERELRSVDLGDARLDVRVRKLVDDLSRCPEAGFNEACRTPADKKASYRFFSNEAVEPESILEAHWEQTWRRIESQQRVLVVQDTTSLDYSSHKQTQGMGPLEAGGATGLFVHSALALTEEGEPLGLVHQQSWARDPEQVGKRHRRRERVWQDKESYKWQRAVEAVVAHQPEGKQLVIIGDRECDVYGVLASPRPAGVDVLVRSAQNRKLQAESGLLHDRLNRGPAAGELMVEVGRAQERPARSAKCEVRYRQVTLKAPAQADAGVPKVPVTIWAVAIWERHAPKAEKALRWVLLASWPITSLEDAVQCATWYSRRWLVERYHYVLKSGCRIEASQLQKRQRLERLEAVYAIIAWRLLALTYQARLRPNQPCDLVLSRQEWQVLYAHHHQQLPSPAQSAPCLGEAMVWVAKLGGYWGRKKDAPPGVKVLWRGLMRLHGMVEGFTLAASLLQPGQTCG
jgi:hypothetical protein